MPHNSTPLSSGRSQSRTSWLVEIPHISLLPPLDVSHKAALDQEVFSQLEHECRKLGGEEGWKNVLVLVQYNTIIRPTVL